TALDVTVQRQVMGLLKGLQEEFGMAVLLITHNFGIIRGVAHRVAVMFRGEIVEEGRVEAVLDSPAHPYTKALIECIPRLGQGRERLATIDHEEIASALRETGDCG
ncbi:MAG: ABC transporter ATP-binding protein, partial [Verrucomicrobiales bacterium]|nr:ABC transporter ATP-binding protein [Verrucomicrobiales bacterium]